MKQRGHIDTGRLRVIAAQMKLWLLDVLLWLAGWAGHALPRDLRIEARADVREALRAARTIVLSLAVARWVAEDARVPCSTKSTRPRGPPRGVRGARHNDMRALMRVVRLRSGRLAERLAEVRDVFDNLDAWVARTLARLRRSPRAARLVLCFVVGDVLRGLATKTPAPTDSS